MNWKSYTKICAYRKESHKTKEKTHILLKLLKVFFTGFVMKKAFYWPDGRVNVDEKKTKISRICIESTVRACVYHTWMFTTNYFLSNSIHPPNAKCIDIIHRRRNVLSSVFWNAHMEKKKIKEISISDKNEFICVVSFPMYLCCYGYSYCGCYKSTRLNIMWHQMYKLLPKLCSNYNISIIKRTSTWTDFPLFPAGKNPAGKNFWKFFKP